MANVILTSSGRLLDLENPKPGQVCIEDIAQSLSRLPRFCGHTKKFYSVAQHSVFVAEILEEMGSPHAYIGLMHEISEACGLGDVASPVKKMLGVEARHAIHEFEGKLCELFEVPHPFPKDVHKADAIALITEFYCLFDSSRRVVLEEWLGGSGLALIEPVRKRIKPLTEEEAYNRFMKKYKQLTKGRK